MKKTVLLIVPLLFLFVSCEDGSSNENTTTVVGFWFACEFGSSNDCMILDDDGYQFTTEGEIYDIEEVNININDVRIDTFRASGAGGQHVNKTDSAVRVTHIPSGTVVECQDGRSQHKNKAQALSVLASRILDAQQHEQQKEQATQRKELVGSGDRSQRIRTYNYPQSRVTDHRINLTLYKLNEIMEGDLESIINPLIVEQQTNQMIELNDTL